MKLHAFAVILCLLLKAVTLQATTYYLRANGNDEASGASYEQAWASLDRLNAFLFLPGDSILLEGGVTFEGSITLGAAVRGTKEEPIVISSFGRESAMISSGAAHGLLVYNSAGFKISRLIFKGGGRTLNAAAGIDFYMDLPETRLVYVHIDSVEVWGYKKSGIQIGSWQGSSGYDEVSITHSSVHDNGEGGISTYAEARLGHKKFYVGHVKAYNNSGLPERTDHHSGSGIVLGGVDGALIEYSEAYNNGWLNAWKGGGPVGIWGYHCNNLLIQYNESHHNRTGTAKDGGGFDIDGGCTNCTIQYNFSHDNDGPGYLIAQYHNAPAMKGVVVRYNISENDARNGNYGAIHLWSSGANGGIQQADIYNNTVYLTPSAKGTPKALFVQSGGVRKGSIRNNILHTSGGLPLVHLDKKTDVKFEGNNYWAGTAAASFYWAGTTYSSLDAWRQGSGQEALLGIPTGHYQDPQLKEPGKGVTLGDPTKLYTLNGYELKASSFLAGSGLFLDSLFGVDMGKRDFWGNSLEQREALSIGAHQPTAGSKACLQGGIIELPALQEKGGVYDGRGVLEGRYFDPQATGTGIHSLRYSYTDEGGVLQKKAFSIRVNDVLVSEWIGLQQQGDDWFESENWSACVPTDFIDAQINIPADADSKTRVGRMPRIKQGTPARVKNLLTPDTLSFSGDGMLEINGVYRGRGMRTEQTATVVFKQAAGQLLPAGDYGRLVLKGAGNSRLAGPVKVAVALEMGQGHLMLGDHNLIVGSQGEILHASAGAYLVTNGRGKLLRQGLNSQRWSAFPVGTESSYTPAYLLNTGQEDDFSVSMQEGVWADGTSGILLENGNVNRTWHIDEGLKGGSQLALKLQWNAADGQPDFVWSEAFISHYEHGTWTKPDESTPFAQQISESVYELSLLNITSFSPFAVRDRGFLLPVGFRDFKVQAAGSEAVLRWETTEEVNNRGFYVEVSLDGHRFRELAFVPASTTASQSNRAYHYRDTDTDTSGLRYYRLRQQDQDGSFAYSEVEALDFTEEKLSVNIYPNPYRQAFNLQLSASEQGKLLLQLSDVYGRAVMYKTAELQKGQNILSFTPDEQLPAGIYLLSLLYEGKLHQLQLVRE